MFLFGLLIHVKLTKNNISQRIRVFVAANLTLNLICVTACFGDV